MARLTMTRRARVDTRSGKMMAGFLEAVRAFSEKRDPTFKGRGSPAMSGRSRKTIHIDVSCFYAAVEMRDNPGLKGVRLLGIRVSFRDDPHNQLDLF